MASFKNLTLTSIVDQCKQEIRGWKRAYWLRRPVLLVLASASLLIIGLQKSGSFGGMSERDPLHWTDRPGLITGVVASVPDPRPKAVSTTIQTETVQIFRPKKSASSLSGIILAHVSGSSTPQAGPGERIELWGRLQKPSSARIPGTFDYADFLRSRGITAVVFTSSSAFRPLGKTDSFSFLRWGWRIRERMMATFFRTLPPDQATVLSGLVVGQRPRFDPFIREMFVRSGTMHVLVASGSNVAFVVGFWFLLVRFVLRWNRRWALLTSLPLIWTYVNVVGQDPPIVRAGIMGTAAILSYLLLRYDRPYQAWACAALILLLKEPRTLFDLGFQMSFVTVFGLIYTLPRIDVLWADRSAWIRWPGRIASATAVAQIWILPVSLHAFGKMFPVGFLSNILVMPLSGAGLFLGFFLSAFDWLAPLVSLYLSLFIGIVSFFARHSGPCLLWMPPSAIWIVGYYTVLLSAPFVIRLWTARAGAVVGIGLMSVGWLLNPHTLPAPDSWRLTWIDLGPRLGLLIETKEGGRVLVNPGPASKSDSSERILLPYFSRRGIRSLDAVVLTPRNPDRYAGLETLKNTIPVGKIITDSDRIGNLDIRFLPGSRAFQSDAAVLISYEKQKILLSYALSLTTQRALLRTGTRSVEVFQSRFSPKIRWLEEFVEKFKPGLLIEAGTGSAYRPAEPPWDDIPLKKPQNEGVLIWPEPS